MKHFLSFNIFALLLFLPPAEAVRCDENFIVWNGYCYYASDVKVDFEEAVAICSTFNADLVSLHSEPETNFVNTLAEYKPIWIGLKSTQERWNWTDGSPVDFINWQTQQPDGCCGVDMTCASTNWIHDTGTWFDTDCKAFSGVVCKYNPRTRIIPRVPDNDISPTAHSASDFRCEDTFVPWNGNCYHSSITEVTYREAHKTCAALNAHVVSLHSTAEDEFVSRLVDYRTIWIGLNKVKEEWRWNDKTKLDHKRWQRFEPDGCCGQYVNCAELKWIYSSPKWLDTCCAKKHAVVCKYNPSTREKKVADMELPYLPEPEKDAEGSVAISDGNITAAKGAEIENRVAQMSVTATETTILKTLTTTIATQESDVDAQPKSDATQLKPDIENQDLMTLLIEGEGDDFPFAKPASHGELKLPPLEPELKKPKRRYHEKLGSDDRALNSKEKEYILHKSARRIPNMKTMPSQSTPIPVWCKCPKNWVMFDNDCFQIFKYRGPLSTERAANRCKKIGASLAFTCSQKELSLIENMAKRFAVRNPLFGLMVDRMFGGCGMSEVLNNTVCCHANWLYGTPMMGNGKFRTCSNYSTKGYWQDFDCASTQYSSVYACRAPCQMDEDYVPT